MLVNGYPDLCVIYFKQSDVDPRELLILFSDLTQALHLNYHISDPSAKVNTLETNAHYRDP